MRRKVLVAFNLSKSARELHVAVSETPAAGAAGSEKLMGDGRVEVDGREIVVRRAGGIGFDFSAELRIQKQSADVFTPGQAGAQQCCARTKRFGSSLLC